MVVIKFHTAWVIYLLFRFIMVFDPDWHDAISKWRLCKLRSANEAVNARSLAKSFLIRTASHNIAQWFATIRGRGKRGSHIWIIYYWPDSLKRPSVCGFILVKDSGASIVVCRNRFIGRHLFLCDPLMLSSSGLNRCRSASASIGKSGQLKTLNSETELQLSYTAIDFPHSTI